MYYVSFAAGPLHLICIKEFIFKKNIKKYSINLLLVSNDNVKIQMIKTIKLLKLKNVNIVYFSQIKIIEILQRYIFGLQLFLKYKKTNTVFLILDFRNTFMHFLRCIFKKSKFILIDDGLQTLESYNEYIKNKIYLPINQYKGFFGKINIFLNFGFQLRHLLFSKIELFSIYSNELNLSKESSNKLLFVSKVLKKKYKLKYSSSLVYFSGTKLVERNALTIDEELYILKKIKNYWKSKGKKLVYVAKRTTSREKLKIIEEKLSIKTIFFDLPLELALMVNHKLKLPNIICSLGSTTNKTIPIIYKKINSYLMAIKNLKLKNDKENYFEYFKKEETIFLN